MTQLQDAYIVAATRTPIGRSGRGFFRNTRPDDLLVAAVKHALAQVPSLDPAAIGGVMERHLISIGFISGEGAGPKIDPEALKMAVGDTPRGKACPSCGGPTPASCSSRNWPCRPFVLP